MTFSSVAIIGGTGNIGIPATHALVNKGFKVKVLTRDVQSAKDKIKLTNVDYVKVDYKDKASLVAAFKGIEVILCPVGAEGIQDQFLWIEAAKEAKVTRFYPCEFGTDNTKIAGRSPVIDNKAKVIEAIKSAGLEWTGIVNGVFLEYIYGPMFCDFKTHTLNLVGTKDTKVSLTPLKAIAEYTVESINNPISKNSFVYVAGETLTYEHVVEIIKKNSGIDWKVVYTPVAQVQAEIDGNPNKYATVMQQFQVFFGDGSYELKNVQSKEFPSVKPQSLADFVASKK